MPLKDRFRRAMGRPSRSSSNSSSSTTHPISTTPTPTTTANPSLTPTPSTMPSITLTKTSTRLSKTLTWNSKSSKAKQEEKAKKRLEDWEKRDEEEWKAPGTKYPGRKSKAHQDLLRAFEWKRGSFEGSRAGEGRRWSLRSSFSGVSPGTSRVNSVEGGEIPKRTGSGAAAAARKRSGGLSREVSREDGGQGMVETVQEE